MFSVSRCPNTNPAVYNLHKLSWKENKFMTPERSVQYQLCGHVYICVFIELIVYLLLSQIIWQSPWIIWNFSVNTVMEKDVPKKFSWNFGWRVKVFDMLWKQAELKWLVTSSSLACCIHYVCVFIIRATASMFFKEA